MKQPPTDSTQSVKPVNSGQTAGQQSSPAIDAVKVPANSKKTAEKHDDEIKVGKKIKNPVVDQSKNSSSSTERSSKPVVAVLTAVIICLALCGLVIYSRLKTAN